MLTNDTTGISFNDSTKIMLDIDQQYGLGDGSKFYYVERDEDRNKDTIVTHSLTDYPKEFQKKVTLLQHFRSYLEADVKGRPKDAPETGGKSSTSVYLKKWMRTKHAIMFRLSNKVVQLNFKDHTEVVLCSASQEIHYRNKAGAVRVLPLSEALSSTDEAMVKRLKYAKDVLMHMARESRRRDEGGILRVLVERTFEGEGKKLTVPSS